MSSRRKTLKNLLYSGLSYAITIAFGLVLPRLFVVNYGSEVNGLLSSLNQLLVYLGLFEAGVGAAACQALYGPIARDDWGEISGIMSAASRHYRRTGHCYLGGLLIISVLYPLLIDSELSYATVFGVVLFSGIGNVVAFYLQGKYNILLQTDGKSYILTNLSTVVTILVSLSKVILIYLNVNIVLILAVSFLVQCVQVVYILLYVRSYSKLDLKAEPDHKALEQKNSALGHQIATLIFNNTDVLILTVFCGLKVVSVYAMYKMVTTHLENILNILSGSVNFVLGQNFQTDRELYVRRIDLLESYYSAAVYAVFSVALFLFTPFMRLYTSGITDVIYVDSWLPLLFVAVSVLNLGRVVTGTTINIAGHFKKTLKRCAAESVINLVTSLILVNICGIYGVLIGTIIALLYRTNDIILYSNRRILKRSARKTYAIHGLGLSLFLITQVVFRTLFAWEQIDSYGQFVLIGIACTVISLMLQAVAQTLVFKHCREFIQDMLSRAWPNKF